MFDLTDAEKNYLEHVIRSLPNAWARDTCRLFVKIFTFGEELRRQLDKPGLKEEERTEIEQKIEYVERSIVELYHGAIEHEGDPLLARLRSRDASFWDNEKESCAFAAFIATQYLRTAKMRDVFINISRPPSVNLERVWPILHQFKTTEIGAALHEARSRYRAIIIENATQIHFITGDQPVINLNPTNIDMKLYYPITPTCALLLTADPFEHPRSVSIREAEWLNREIYRWSLDQLYGVDLDYLKWVCNLDKIPPT